MRNNTIINGIFCVFFTISSVIKTNSSSLSFPLSKEADQCLYRWTETTKPTIQIETQTHSRLVGNMPPRSAHWQSILSVSFYLLSTSSFSSSISKCCQVYSCTIFFISFVVTLEKDSSFITILSVEGINRWSLCWIVFCSHTHHSR